MSEYTVTYKVCMSEYTVTYKVCMSEYTVTYKVCMSEYTITYKVRMSVSYLTLGRTYMFPVNQHLSYIKIIYSIIIINNDHINIHFYIMPYRIHS